MAYRTLLLHLDELAEIGESTFHLRAQSSQRRSLNGTLEKLACKGSVHGEPRVAAEGRFFTGTVIVGVG